MQTYVKKQVNSDLLIDIIENSSAGFKYWFTKLGVSPVQCERTVDFLQKRDEKIKCSSIRWVWWSKITKKKMNNWFVHYQAKTSAKVNKDSQCLKMALRSRLFPVIHQSTSTPPKTPPRLPPWSVCVIIHLSRVRWDSTPHVSGFIYMRSLIDSIL